MAVNAPEPSPRAIYGPKLGGTATVVSLEYSHLDVGLVLRLLVQVQ